jgi:AraC-like DNA-binding protein
MGNTCDFRQKHCRRTAGNGQALLELLSLLAAAQGLLLTALLWLHPGDRAANRWLAASIAAYSLLTGSDALARSGGFEHAPHLIYLFDWTVLLVGPLVYRYVLALTGASAPRRRTLCLHALPALLLLLMLLPFYVMSGAAKLRLLSADLAARRIDPLLILAAAQVLAYWIASLCRVRRFRLSLEQHYSNLERLKLGWLSAFLAANMLLWAAWIVSLLSGLRLEWLESLAAPLTVYGLGYVGLRHPGVFGANAMPLAVADATRTVTATDAATAAATAAVPPKYAKSALDGEQLARFKQRLDACVLLEKPFLEDELTLGELAHRVGISTHQLSQLLSVGYGQSFYDFINQRRVAEVQRCLRDPAFQQQSVLDVGLASGFSSKATFNAAFKKHAGTTPSAYRSGAEPA